MKSKEWVDGTQDEIGFWDRWFETKGLDWPDDYRQRIDNDTELTGVLTNFVNTGTEKILDAGSGPISILGKKYKGIKLDITCCDALADGYAQLLKKHGISIQPPMLCEMEMAHEKFSRDEFDIIHVCNCMDHCYDPVEAIRSLLCVLKPGGIMVLYHEVNEATNEQWKGLHQWNFFLDRGAFFIASKEYALNVDHFFRKKCSIESKIEAGHIVSVIKKTERPIPMAIGTEKLKY